MARAGPTPAGVRVASSVTLGPWLRGTRPTARSPRGARARRRVSAVWVLVSSTKIRSAGLRVAASSRHAVRAASLRSVAMSDFFLSGQPARCSARDIVARLTRMPVVASHWRAVLGQRGVRGSAHLGHQRRRGCGVIRGRRPGRGRAVTTPVSRRRRRHRLIVLTPMPKRRAASAWGRPASMAPNSRSRRSAEYCFTAIASHEANFSATRFEITSVD